jgi:hypothetical protein
MLVGLMGLALVVMGPAYAGTEPAPAEAASTEEVATEQPTEEETKEELAAPQAPERPTPSQVQRGGLLVGKGKLELEYRLAYAHISRNMIFIDGVAILPVLVVGEIAVERIRRDILIGAITGRYGLRDDLQMELTIPYRYQSDRSSIPEATPAQESILSDHAPGDIEFALFRQLPGSARRETKLIAGWGVKTRTGKDVFGIDPNREHPMGSGFWNTKLSLTAVRVSDPAAIFGTVAYTHNFPRKNFRVTIEDPETGEPSEMRVSFYPGHTIELGFGLAYALNPKLSINGQFTTSWTEATRVETEESGGRVPIIGTTLTAASLRFGAVWLSSQRFTTELSVDMGLTLDAPDMQTELRRTYRF